MPLRVIYSQTRVSGVSLSVQNTSSRCTFLQLGKLLTTTVETFTFSIGGVAALWWPRL